jgi:Ca2+-dependent lipid-binding protein
VRRIAFPVALLAALGAVWRYRIRLQSKVRAVQVGDIKDALTDGAGGVVGIAKGAASTAKDVTGDAVGTIADVVKGAGHDASRAAAKSVRKARKSA